MTVLTDLINKLCPSSPEQDGMMTGLEGVSKGRMSSRVHLAPPRASQAAGQNVQGYFSEKLKKKKKGK